MAATPNKALDPIQDPVSPYYLHPSDSQLLLVPIPFNGIGFNLAHKFHLMSGDRLLDIIYTLDENEWNGEKQLQLKVVDLRLSE